MFTLNYFWLDFAVTDTFPRSATKPPEKSMVVAVGDADKYEQVSIMI